MKQFFKSILTIGLFMIVNSLVAQNTKALQNDITSATQASDSERLATYFNDKIELITPDNTGVYSKEQAEQVIKKFFDAHPITSFEIVHQGVKDDSSFAIGNYVSKSISFRFYFRIKESNGKVLIHQLWIENQDEQ